LQSDARFSPENWLVLGAGLAWFGISRGSWLGFILAIGPGALLVASGVATLLGHGEGRLRDMAALGGGVGALLAIVLSPLWGAAGALALLALSGGAFVAAGALAARDVERVEGAPHFERTLGLGSQIATDRAIRGAMLSLIPFLPAGEHARLSRELEDASKLWSERGWNSEPATYHDAPPPAERATSRTRRTLGAAFEELRFESGYAPHEGEPGRERYLGYEPNRLAWAWLLRTGEPSRPWLVCIHGYQMGTPAIDLQVFRAQQWRERGFNVVLPVLPFHGPRRIGAISGIGMFGADFLDSAHALAQAMWDVRRLLGWIREQGGSDITCYGLSLGGYSAALLASLAPELRAVVAGIPAADFVRLVLTHAPAAERDRMLRAGVTRELATRVMRPVSPLALTPLVPHERRFVFGAPDDQFVPADQVRDLISHWGKPRHVWFPGAHVTFRVHEPVQALVAEALRSGGSRS
jgi:pimeloyl-ACP methyl ester carboxylesterase